eukprot:jgi/Picsp_1/4807/NSC_02175-R1_cell wall surface anchor family protein
MSKTFEKVLLGLKEVQADRIRALEALGQENSAWLQDVVEEARRNVEETLGASEKRRKIGKSAKLISLRNTSMEKEKRKARREVKRVAALPEILESVAEEDEEAVGMPVDEVPQERSEEAPKRKAIRGGRKTRTQQKAREAEPAAEIGSEEASSPPATRNKRVTRASKRKQEEASVSISTVDVIEEAIVTSQKEETEIEPVASKPRRGRPPKKGTKPKANPASKGRASKKKQEECGIDKSEDNRMHISDDLPSVKEDTSALKNDESMMEEHGALLEEVTLTKEVTPSSKMHHHIDAKEAKDVSQEGDKAEDDTHSKEQDAVSEPPLPSVFFPCSQQQGDNGPSPSPLPDNKAIEKETSEYKDEPVDDELESLQKLSTASDSNGVSATLLQSPLCQNNDAEYRTKEQHIHDITEVIETACQPQNMVNSDEASGSKEAMEVDDKSFLDGMHFDSPKSLNLPDEKSDFMIQSENQKKIEEKGDSEPSFSHKLEPASSQGQEKGFAANLVSSLKTFLPSKLKEPPQALSKKAAKVKALEAANAARKKEEEKAIERARQKAELERIRQERLKAKAEAEKEEARRREELQRKKEQEIAARRRAREDAEKREKEEKARRLEEHKRRRKMEAEAAARTTDPSGKQNSVIATSGSKSLAEAKERLAKIQQQAAMLKNQGTVQSNASESAKPTSSVQFKTETIDKALKVPSYEISPYKSDFESDDDVPKKPVPDWARGKALVGQLMAQMYIDPDEVFQQHAKTCSLDEVFASCRRSVHQDFNKRSSSGNWIEDRVTWKEELNYKKAMGYI